MVDAGDSKSPAARLVGSSPTSGTSTSERSRRCADLPRRELVRLAGEARSRQNRKPGNTIASGTGETARAMVAGVASGAKMPLRPAIFVHRRHRGRAGSARCDRHGGDLKDLGNEGARATRVSCDAESTLLDARNLGDEVRVKRLVLRSWGEARTVCQSPGLDIVLSIMELARADSAASAAPVSWDGGTFDRFRTGRPGRCRSRRM